MPQTDTKYFPLGGGLDVSTAALSVAPGKLITCVNFEPWYNDGYRRIDGYERFDGRPRPHKQTFYGFDVLAIGAMMVGDTLTGDSSGATGEVIGISGNSVAVTKTTGTFTTDEALNTGTYTIDGVIVARLAPTQDLEDEWLLAAWDLYRDDIAVVPGSGVTRGAWRRRGNTYAIRDNVGATAGVLHLASAAGWTTTGLTLTDTLIFNTGGGTTNAALPVVGDTITGGTSGATAVVHRIVNWAGGTASNDATGYMVLTSVTGGPFTDTEQLQVSAVHVASANGVNVPFELSPGGTYRFHNHNFFATTGTFHTYAVNGVDDAFEIDENNFVFSILIPSIDDLVGFDLNADGAPPGASDKPFLLEEHGNHLFLAFPGGRVVQSVQGFPGNFSGFLNAAEFGLGDEVTGLSSVVGSVLVMTTERETHGLFGKNLLDWEKKLIGENTGGRLYTSRKLDTVYALDDLGITSIARTDQFGDFIGSTVSQLIQPIINVLRDLVTDATIVRSSNQYRLYFSDKTALIMYKPQVGGDTRAGASTSDRPQFGVASYPIAFTNVYNTEDELGVERSFMVSDDSPGMVFEDRVGNNFDGLAIDSYVRTAFSHLGTPSLRKKFRRADLEMTSAKPLELKITSDLSYGSAVVSSGVTDITTSDIQQITVFAGGGFWDTDNWDEFFWDGQNISTARAHLRGTGENVSFLMYNQSAVVDPFILQGLTIHYDKRRLQR